MAAFGGVRIEPGAGNRHGGVTMRAILACNGRGFLMVVALACLATAPGCAGLGQAPAVAYVRGDLDATLEVPLDQAVRAARAAVAQLEFTPIEEKKDALQALVVARNALERRIEIRLDREGERVTRLRIRVGTFGDEAVAVATYVKLTANL